MALIEYRNPTWRHFRPTGRLVALEIPYLLCWRRQISRAAKGIALNAAWSDGPSLLRDIGKAKDTLRECVFLSDGFWRQAAGWPGRNSGKFG